MDAVADDEQVLQDNVVHGRTVFAALGLDSVDVEIAAVEHQAADLDMCRVGQADRVAPGAPYEYCWRAISRAVDADWQLRGSVNPVQGQPLIICARIQREIVPRLQEPEHRLISRRTSVQRDRLRR